MCCSIPLAFSQKAATRLANSNTWVAASEPIGSGDGLFISSYCSIFCFVTASFMSVAEL